MKPLILKFQEKLEAFKKSYSLGTETITKTREGSDNDIDNMNMFLGTKTGTATRESSDADFDLTNC